MNSESTEITEIRKDRSRDRPGDRAASSVEWTLRPESSTGSKQARREGTVPWDNSCRGWILYDGNCRYCIASTETFAGFFGRRGFEFLPLQTPWVMQRLGLQPDAPLEEMRVLTRDGCDLGGVNALLFLAKQIWWAWPVVALAHLPGVYWLLDRAYRWIAAHRGCDHVACKIKQRRLLSEPLALPSRRPSRRLLKTAVKRAPLLGAWAAWIPPAILPILAVLIRDGVAPWQFMWLMAASIFFGCKCLTFWRVGDRCHPSLLRTLGYFFAWPGMDADRFLSRARQNLTALSRQVVHREPWRDELSLLLDVQKHVPPFVASMTKIFLGAVLLFGVARLTHPPLLAGWLGMIGIILVLHFGIFALLAIAWRSYDVDVRPIMDSPLRSRTLGEFWGRRWNGGFNQLAFDFVFNPLVRRRGGQSFSDAGKRSRRSSTLHFQRRTGIATLAAFLLSGLIHELVISLPAGAGYGLPTAYFLLQGCGVIMQHRVVRIRRGMIGRFFTILVVAAPAFWLFHPPFVRNVVLPFMKAMEAL